MGRTGLPVTALGFGGAGIGNLGAAVDDDTAWAAVDAAWAGGVRYFDTAPHYGLGLSERRLGAALAGRPRADFTLCTKVGRLLRPNPHRTGSDLGQGGFAVRDDLTRAEDFSAVGVRRSLEESLLRLGLDRVDVLLVHRPDEHVAQVLAETLPALAALRAQGLIRAFGVATGRWQTAVRLVRAAPMDLVVLAGGESLSSVPTLIDECRQRGVAPMASVPCEAIAPSHYPLVAHFRTPADVITALEKVRTRSGPGSHRRST